MKINLSENVIIYPSKEGWIKIYETFANRYRKPYNEAINHIDEYNRTDDNGFKEQLWVIMEMYNGLLYNGSTLLSNMDVDLLNNYTLSEQDKRSIKLQNILDNK